MPHHRLVLITSLLAFGVALSGCSSFDPSEWFNTKKPLPGERKNVFPQGVPGVPQGVPPELVEGYTPPVEPVPEPLPVQEQPKAKPRPKPRPKVAAAPRPVPAPRQQQQTQQPAQQQAGGQAPWPAAPAPSQAAPASQSQSVFPDPPRR
jgi:hypothetical protein